MFFLLVKVMAFNYPLAGFFAQFVDGCNAELLQEDIESEIAGNIATIVTTDLKPSEILMERLNHFLFDFSSPEVEQLKQILVDDTTDTTKALTDFAMKFLTQPLPNPLPVVICCNDKMVGNICRFCPGGGACACTNPTPTVLDPNEVKTYFDLLYIIRQHDSSIAGDEEDGLLMFMPTSDGFAYFKKDL